MTKKSFDKLVIRFVDFLADIGEKMTPCRKKKGRR